MEKLIAIVQIGSLTQRYDLPEWARDNIDVLGGPGFVVRGQQFHWYDYIVKTEWEGVKECLARISIPWHITVISSTASKGAAHEHP